jgi:hypothetical protein
LHKLQQLQVSLTPCFLVLLTTYFSFYNNQSLKQYKYTTDSGLVIGDFVDESMLLLLVVVLSLMVSVFISLDIVKHGEFLLVYFVDDLFRIGVLVHNVVDNDQLEEKNDKEDIFYIMNKTIMKNFEREIQRTI